MICYRGRLTSYREIDVIGFRGFVMVEEYNYVIGFRGHGEGLNFYGETHVTGFRVLVMDKN